jgi:hypothetical protein
VKFQRIARLGALPKGVINVGALKTLFIVFPFFFALLRRWTHLTAPMYRAHFISLLPCNFMCLQKTQIH